MNFLEKKDNQLIRYSHIVFCLWAKIWCCCMTSWYYWHCFVYTFSDLICWSSRSSISDIYIVLQVKIQATANSKNRYLSPWIFSFLSALCCPISHAVTFSTIGIMLQSKFTRQNFGMTWNVVAVMQSWIFPNGNIF